MTRDITESEYFFYGSADKDKNENHYAQYGLYDPISNRFVLVSKFYEALNTVAMLWAGRLSLRICKLHSADNFEPTLIDNSCCTSWAISNLEDMQIFRGLKSNIDTKVFPVSHLVLAEPTGPELIVDNLEYLMATYIWTTDEERRFWLMSLTDPFYQTELSISSYVELPLNLSPTACDIKKVHNIIFTGADFSTVKEQVESVLKSYK